MLDILILEDMLAAFCILFFNRMGEPVALPVVFKDPTALIGAALGTKG